MADKDKKASAKNKKETKKVSFFQGVKREWGKIIWPTREDLTRQTALVVIISIVMGVAITVVDSGALQIINWIMSI